MKFTIEDFNNKINKSGNIKERYNNWLRYRKEIKNAIEILFERREFNNLIVLGAGLCNDLDIKFLSDNIKKIYLSDIDIDSTKLGIQNQNIPNKSKKIEIIKCDFTGFESIGFFKEFYNMLEDNKDTQEIVKFIDKSVNSIRISEILKYYKEYFDLVIIMPIYTQLLYNQLNIILDSVDGDQNKEKIRNTFLNFMPLVIRRFNEVVFSIGKKDADFLMITDLLEYNRENIFHIENKVKDFSYIDNLMKNYIEKYGYGLGSYGKLHFTENIKIYYEDYLLWPFDGERYFLNYLCLGKKRFI